MDLNKLISLLKENPCSISDVSKKLGINWRTAKSYLSLLKSLDLVKEDKNRFFYKDKNNYFHLPVKPKHEKIIRAIYTLINKFAKREPTKTQAYKILWKVDKQFNLHLPIGWYKYGPCPEIIHTGDENTSYNLPKEQVSFIKETTEEYVALDNFDLQKKIYQEEKKGLYLVKEELLHSEENKPNDVLMNLIKAVPKEAVETTTDFVRTVLLLGWNEKTRGCFNYLWKYLTIISHKETLSFYYEDIGVYMDNKIADAKKDAQLMILNLVDNYMDSKHSQDSRYQAWKKKRNR